VTGGECFGATQGRPCFPAFSSNGLASASVMSASGDVRIRAINPARVVGAATASAALRELSRTSSGKRMPENAAMPGSLVGVTQDCEEMPAGIFLPPMHATASAPLAVCFTKIAWPWQSPPVDPMVQLANDGGTVGQVWDSATETGRRGLNLARRGLLGLERGTQAHPLAAVGLAATAGGAGIYGLMKLLEARQKRREAARYASPRLSWPV
jgi:hypothetical protein